MPRELNPVPQVSVPGCYGIVAARFNEIVVDQLLKGTIEAFQRAGVPAEAIEVARVPGSFELPFAASCMVASRRYQAIVALGCILRGDTDHYDHVAGAATAGLADIARHASIPVVFGVLTCDTLEQALHRAGGKVGNKGAEAAQTALEMASLAKVLREGATNG